MVGWDYLGSKAAVPDSGAKLPVLYVIAKAL